MQPAILVFAEARGASLRFSTPKAAYDEAARLLESAGSPLTLLARLGAANAVVFAPGGGYALSRALLDPIEQEARSHGYRHLVARIHTTRANCFGHESRYTESLAESDAAIAEYRRSLDAENFAEARLRRIGVLRTAGQTELAWRDAPQAAREISGVVSPQTRHNVLGEVSSAALAAGFPRVALLYENTAIRLLRRMLIAIPPEQLNRIRNAQVNLSAAFRARANIEVHLDQYGAAAADIAEAIRLGTKKDVDAGVQQTLSARMSEVEGKAWLHSDPARSVTAFSQALKLAGNEFLTFRAALLAQRAEAERRAGRNAAAEEDLRAAVAQLRAEEERTLQHRQRGQDEEIWSAYFSRFSEPYQLLTRQLIEEGRTAEAFDYAEQARASEPLDLISTAAPNDYGGKPKSLTEIRQALPPGTVLIEYSVLENQVVAWVVSRDVFGVIRLKAGRDDVARWSAALQRAARARNQPDFENQSYALYDGLIAEPLAALKTMPQRLVIVPDGPMHGLPFAALHNPKTDRYLIEEAPIEIAGSANLYLVSLSRDAALAVNREPSVLVVGDPAFNGQLALAQGLQPLPRARRESEKIYELYAPHAELLQESDATIPRFLDRARNSTIIHIAAHTVVNAQTPSRSFILFAPSASDPGPLDIQALLTRLTPDHTNLVVLSTCSSAGGLPVGAEGVAPFVRPLIGAGVPAVIGTLWNVEDATAEEVLVSFHRRYRQGSDAAVALQLAQLELLRNKNKNPGLRSVLAWAPFQVIGHGSSPFAATTAQQEKPP